MKIKRSELINYLADEISDIIKDAENKNPNYSMEKFLKSKAESALAMIEGMLDIHHDECYKKEE